MLQLCQQYLQQQKRWSLEHKKKVASAKHSSGYLNSTGAHFKTNKHKARGAHVQRPIHGLAITSRMRTAISPARSGSHGQLFRLCQGSSAMLHSRRAYDRAKPYIKGSLLPQMRSLPNSLCHYFAPRFSCSKDLVRMSIFI